jgi:hypothetical protein
MNAREIRMELDLIDGRMRYEKDDHVFTIKSLECDRIKIQSQCKHTSWTYHIGGVPGESYSSCAVCGKRDDE